MSHGELQELLDAMTENAAIVDEKGYILFVNKAWVTFSAKNRGTSKYTDVGANYFQSVHRAIKQGDEYAAQVENGIQDILHGKITEFELEYPCHGNNKQRWFITNFKEIGSRCPRIFLFTHKDVTNLVLREQKIIATQRMEIIGQFSGGIAHDFNNLLGVIMGSLELALTELPAPSDSLDPLAFPATFQLTQQKQGMLRGYLDNALLAVQRGASLVQRILLFSKEQKLAPEYIDANAFIEETLCFINRTLGEDIRIETQFEEKFFSLYTDTSMLGNSILNIAINARHAMPTGGVLIIKTARVDLNDHAFMAGAKKGRGPYVQISFTDNGCGINKNDLQKVLTPFFTTKKKGQGSGLGLSMISNFIQQARGGLDIASCPGKGTTISLYLPLKAESLPHKNLDKKNVRKQLKNKTFLLVEDDVQVRNVAASMLTCLEHKVIQAQDGRLALTILEKNADIIDCVLTDAVMPAGISGCELIQEIRQACPRIKLLLMSGYSKQCCGQTSVPILSKPFSLEKLELAINNLFFDVE
ncbi:response regulator [Desulfobulbus sp. TB]|nr:response regulator [Desulfobulbus sp. TB]